MLLNFFELLGIFIMIYVFRYLAEPAYRSRKKRNIVIEIIITSVLAFMLMWIFTIITKKR